jgi:ketosteroid isomerase-like protein
LSDPIPPPAARLPEEALELVSHALSDGDLEAALAQYEHDALLRPWAEKSAGDGDGVDVILRNLMELRLPLSATIRAVLPNRDLALVLGERHMAGRGPYGQRVQLSGLGATVVRQRPDGTWRIVIDTWGLDGPGAADVRD